MTQGAKALYQNMACLLVTRDTCGFDEICFNPASGECIPSPQSESTIKSRKPRLSLVGALGAAPDTGLMEGRSSNRTGTSLWAAATSLP